MISCHYDELDEPAMVVLAKKLATCLSAPLLMTLSGSIGAGKTTLIRAVLRAMRIDGPIKNPTFSLVESYTTDRLDINHFDLYRIQDERELDYLGLRDFFTDHSVCFIEWPERSQWCLDNADIQCSITIQGLRRRLHFNALTACGEKVLACLDTP